MKFRKFKQFIEAIVWQKVMDEVPNDVAEQLEHIPEDLLHQMINAIGDDAEETGQDIPSLWRKYINAKSIADIYRIKTSHYQLGQNKRIAKVLDPKDQIRNNLYNSTYQKLASLFNIGALRQLPADIVKIFNYYPEWQKYLVAPKFWDVKRRNETVFPFFKDSKGNIIISPEFPYMRYKEWSDILNRAIMNMSH